MGDWRLFYLYRDRLRKVTTADVQRAADTYLKPANRVLGMFVPTDEARPRRRSRRRRTCGAALDAYRSGEAVRRGRGLRPDARRTSRRA